MKQEQQTWEQQVIADLYIRGLVVQSFTPSHVICLTRDGKERKIEIVYNSEANNADKQ